MNYIRIGLFLLISFLLTACGASTTEKKSENEELEIYTTVYPLEDFTKKIGGEYVDVHSIYPPGADEHTFEPSQKDMIDMAEGDVFFYVGMGLEGFVEKSKSILEQEDVTVVPASKGLEIEHSEDEEHDEHGDDDHGHEHDGDPHIWLNPAYSKHMADIIADTLIEQMPEHKEDFQANLKELNRELDSLDAEFMQMAEAAPHKTFYVSHAAYSYWEDRYGLHQEAIAGLNTSDEPSQKELKAIIEKGKEDDVNYILFEQNVSSRLTEVVQKELGAKSLKLHNLSVLTEKDLQEDEDYFSLMRKNIKTLEKALQ
ncbi:zinc ABC transporter substrate-binding protein [Rossellomorea aquimaris]|uniref:metal ABC transporter solute-binding protein, Zn/Mn family n=1 Tax=Rossellomorea aquimaris TaxID=189382 RepID=UPI001CD76831|nr:zinc ABC transporter substrate-binding protein [Rossellomorea aquimaris]MCA1056799.1 zinc ABC transporter substrate-binding protein [Rossellomorea aquimaris]